MLPGIANRQWQIANSEQHEPRRKPGLQHLCPSVFICGGPEFLRLSEFERTAAIEELEKVAFMRLIPTDVIRRDGAKIQPSHQRGR